jgi:oxygen-independent coproporphyrinogen-3 oxidase
MDRYVSALCGEMRMRSRAADRLEAVYIGGGTPSILGDDNIRRIIYCLFENYELRDGAEITAEANPDTLTADKARLFRDSGVNRLSIGVQSLRDRELSLLGRPHDAASAIRAFGDARDAGFDNISLDLIYGIPGQTVSVWLETLGRIAGLGPEHISTYELTPEEHTPIFKALEAGELALCDEEDVVSMYNGAIDSLAGHGYGHYEISNFALPGRGCRHNLNYWNRGGYLGFGAGAGSFEDECRSMNAADIDRYIADVDDGVLPVSERTLMDNDDRIKETLFLGLRKMEGFDLDLIPAPALDKMRETLRDLIRQGLLDICDRRLRLTRRGILLCNEIIVRLMLCNG